MHAASAASTEHPPVEKTRQSRLDALRYKTQADYDKRFIKNKSVWGRCPCDDASLLNDNCCYKAFCMAVVSRVSTVRRTTLGR